MNLEKLFTYLKDEAKMEITESLKSQLTDVFKVALAEKDAAIDSISKEKVALEEKVNSLNEELTAVKEKIVTDVKAEVEAYKESLVEKIDSFLDSELSTLIPEELVEAKAKLEIYEPLVEGFKSTIARYGITIDSEGHDLLKEAKTEIETLVEEVNSKTKAYMDLEKAASKLLAKHVLAEKCVGLTEAQAEKVAVVFAGKDADEINEKFETIAALIINEKVEEQTEDSKKTELVKENVELQGTKVDEKVETEDLGQKYLLIK